jgi:type III pantothenate kinase
MILAIDVGNSQIYAGVFSNGEIKLRFRRTSKSGASSDELGVFLRSVLRENSLDPSQIDKIGICTVVPEALHSLRNACVKYFDRNPFILQAGVKTGLKVKYKNPLEVGADRIANAIAAVHEYPEQDLLVIDFGTATTFCAINSQKEYLGGVITAGVRISMEALESKTSKLPAVEIIQPEHCLGRTTVESIQSGLYFGSIGQVLEIRDRITREAFDGRMPRVIGTGGFASLLARAGIFDEENPDLVLKGIFLALGMNT